MIPDGKVDPHKRMKNIKTGNYMGKYVRFFLLFKYPNIIWFNLYVESFKKTNEQTMTIKKRETHS